MLKVQTHNLEIYSKPIFEMDNYESACVYKPEYNLFDKLIKTN